MREAVVVLDMTRDSIAPEARAVDLRRAVLPRVEKYLAWARGKGMPVDGFPSRTILEMLRKEG